MRKTFVMRGQTASGETEILNFSGFKSGYAYKMTEFKLYPSTGILGTAYEIVGSVTAGKIAVAPTDPNFNDEGLIATTSVQDAATAANPISMVSVVNDTFMITQNLILMVQDGVNQPVNWQCRFESVKMTGAEEASVNYKQFAISDE